MVVKHKIPKIMPQKDKKIHASSIESPLVIGVNLIYNAATDAYIFDPS